jgi:hypothetical protein
LRGIVDERSGNGIWEHSRVVRDEILRSEIVDAFDGVGELCLYEIQKDIEVLELNGALLQCLRLGTKFRKIVV